MNKLYSRKLPSIYGQLHPVTLFRIIEKLGESKQVMLFRCFIRNDKSRAIKLLNIYVANLSHLTYSGLFLHRISPHRSPSSRW